MRAATCCSIPTCGLAGGEGCVAAAQWAHPRGASPLDEVRWADVVRDIFGTTCRAPSRAAPGEERRRASSHIGLEPCACRMHWLGIGCRLWHFCHSALLSCLTCVVLLSQHAIHCQTRGASLAVERKAQKDSPTWSHRHGLHTIGFSHHVPLANGERSESILPCA
jgi:hypothetical protein